MTPESRRRLEAHAQAIVAAGGVPPVLREELVEELVGHLAARVEAATAAGTPEAEAVDRAIASFGSADRLGRDFQRTYHSRIWASTIGVLLPQVATGNPRPGAVGWLRFGVGLTIVVTSIAGVVALPSASPLRLLVGGPMLLASLVVGLLAFRALARGQRWALRYAMAVAVLLVAYGVRDVLFPAQPRTITFPIGAFVGVAILLVAQGSWVALQAFVNGSRPIGARLGLLVTATLVLPPLLFLPFADPTLASARDLEMHLSVTCDIGDVDIGDGQAVVFKMESHNHPSYIEPYQGATTGVGGILRDVFTMGARPIAVLNSLRFGSLDSARVRYLFAGVVRGIGDYGNCMGVPTVAGDVVFDDAYAGNPLVNAMCVGVMRQDEAEQIRARFERLTAAIYEDLGLAAAGHRSRRLRLGQHREDGAGEGGHVRRPDGGEESRERDQRGLEHGGARM